MFYLHLRTQFLFLSFIFLLYKGTFSSRAVPKFNTQTSSNAHISSGVCPEGMSDLRHLWLAVKEGWRKGKGEGRGRESADSDTVSVCREHRNQLARSQLPLPVLLQDLLSESPGVTAASGLRWHTCCIQQTSYKRDKDTSQTWRRQGCGLAFQTDKDI